MSLDGDPGRFDADVRLAEETFVDSALRPTPPGPRSRSIGGRTAPSRGVSAR